MCGVTEMSSDMGGVRIPIKGIQCSERIAIDPRLTLGRS
jgi:hypothetical protein